MQLKVIEAGTRWQIDQIAWLYPNEVRKSSQPSN